MIKLLKLRKVFRFLRKFQKPRKIHPRLFCLNFSRHTVSSQPRAIRRRVINKYRKTSNVSNICFGVRTRSWVVHIDYLQWKTKKLVAGFSSRKNMRIESSRWTIQRNSFAIRIFHFFNVYLSSFAALDCLRD